MIYLVIILQAWRFVITAVVLHSLNIIAGPCILQVVDSNIVNIEKKQIASLLKKQTNFSHPHLITSLSKHEIHKLNYLIAHFVYRDSREVLQTRGGNLQTERLLRQNSLPYTITG